MKIVLLVTLLFVATFTFKLDKIRADDGKVKVDFYYESLCPYCQQFIERSLKQAAATKVFLLLNNTGLLENLRLQPLPLRKCQKSPKWIQLDIYLPTWRKIMPR